jgi:tripartite-type tricarboxylate transporter receptor subunit TctC
MITNPLLIKDLSYDPDKDFTLVSAMPTGSICFVASDKSGARTLAEFIDYARKAEKVSIGTFGAGSIAHLMIAELNREFGLKIEAVHYRGEVPMWADLSGQFIDAGVGSYSGSLSVTQTGRGKTVAVSIKRNPKLPEIPTFKEQGASSPAFSITTFQCCVAPSGTPERVAREISNLLVEAGKTDKIMQMLDKFGIADPAMDFDATQRLYKNESPVWKELVSKLGIVL